MAIVNFTPREASIGSTIHIELDPETVSDPNFTFGGKATWFVLVGKVQATGSLTPDRKSIFFEVPPGLNPGKEYDIVVNDAENIYPSPGQLKIKSEEGVENPGDNEVTVTNVSPPKVIRTEISEGQANFNPTKITLEGNNLHLVTSVSLNTTRIPRIIKTEKSLIINLPVFLPKAPAGIYTITLTYGHQNRLLKVRKQLKVNDQK